MNAIEKFSQNHVLSYSIFVALAFVIIFGFGFVSLLIIPFLPEEFFYLPGYDYILSSINNFVAFIVLIFLIKETGIAKNIPWNVEGIFKGLLLGIPLIIFSIVQLVLMYNNTFDKTVFINWLGVIFGLIYCISIALWEELLCRGLILTSILKQWHNKEKGVFKSIVVSSLIFGCAHIITAINGNLIASIVQVFYASVMGMLIGAIYIKTRSLYSAISLHFILNLVAYLIPFIMPFIGGMFDFEFISILAVFSAIWIFATYMIVQRITENDLEFFIQ